MTTYRPAQLSVDDLLNELNTMIRFIPNAEPAEPHDICERCRQEWPIRHLHGISDQDDYNRILGILEEDPDAAMCPECRDELVTEARNAVCKCGDHRCNGPRQVDVDRWECWTYLYR